MVTILEKNTKFLLNAMLLTHYRSRVETAAMLLQLIGDKCTQGLFES